MCVLDLSTILICLQKSIPIQTNLLTSTFQCSFKPLYISNKKEPFKNEFLDSKPTSRVNIAPLISILPWQYTKNSIISGIKKESHNRNEWSTHLPISPISNVHISPNTNAINCFGYFACTSTGLIFLHINIHLRPTPTYPTPKSYKYFADQQFLWLMPPPPRI